jgi:uncharacterized protein YdaU (DUF1376 family)
MHYYKFNISDYIKDASHLSLLEHGIYRLLLDAYYKDEGPLPEKNRLMRLLCVRTTEEEQALNNVLNDFFIESGSGYINKRCDKELEQVFAKSEKAAKAAKERWKKYQDNQEDEANAMRTHSESNADGMPPINTEPNNTEPNRKHTSDSSESNKRFLMFWNNYPRKDNKKKAETAFKRLKKSEQETAITDCLTRFSGVEKQYIPIPTTYINGKRWEDETKPSELQEPVKPDWATIPRNDDALWSWAKKHGFGNPGQMTYQQYRKSLETQVERRLSGETL